MSSSSSDNSTLSLDHLTPPSEQLCYVHCNICDTVLAVSVPCSNLFKTVTVRCGHCTNLLPVNMRGLVLPSANQFHHLGHSFLNNSHNNNSHNLLGFQEEMLPNMNIPVTPKFVVNQTSVMNEFAVRPIADQLARPPPINKPSEKRQRVPSAYNRFIKDEIQRIKTVNPDISHREAFSAAAKNWAHFPHIHFGLMPDQTVARKQEGEDNVMMKDGLFASANNVRVAPY